MRRFTSGSISTRGRRLGAVLCGLGMLAAAALAAPPALHAEAGALTDAQQATLSAGLAEKKPFAELIAQAQKDGMPCEAVAAYLCAKAGNGPSTVYDIVYAALTGGCDAAKVITAVLKAGAPLPSVVRAAQDAGVSAETIRTAAKEGGASPGQIANALAGTSGGGGAGGVGEGGAPGAGGGFGGPFGGGAGGAAPASPSKP
jgi:hypothetical protein